jgi:hypothetical protein
VTGGARLIFILSAAAIAGVLDYKRVSHMCYLLAQRLLKWTSPEIEYHRLTLDNFDNGRL